MLTDTMYSLPSYGQASLEEYGLRIVDVSIIVIRDDMIFSKCLAAKLRASYIRNNRVGKMLIKPSAARPLFLNSTKNA